MVCIHHLEVGVTKLGCELESGPRAAGPRATFQQNPSFLVHFLASFTQSATNIYRSHKICTGRLKGFLGWWGEWVDLGHSFFGGRVAQYGTFWGRSELMMVGVVSTKRQKCPQVWCLCY